MFFLKKFVSLCSQTKTRRMMRNRILGLVVLGWVAVAAFAQQSMQLQAGETDVCVEFYTPSIVRVVKSLGGTKYAGKTLVVTAQPEAVEVTRNGNNFSCDTLMVKVDPKTGSVSFFFMIQLPPRSTLLPLTPLFRSSF